MEPTLDSLLAELLAILPDYQADSPERDHELLALYTVAYKVLNGFDPPCAVRYEPELRTN